MKQRFPCGRTGGLTLLLPALLTACQPPVATLPADPAPGGTVTPRKAHAVAVDGNRIYVYGGNNVTTGNNYLDSLEMYEP